MIKLTLPLTLSIITYIINTSISEGVFPDLWKLAKIIPLPKAANITDYKDLRPISILPAMTKTIEKLVCNQLSMYLERFNLLPEVQSGFRKGHGTATALAVVTDASDRGEGTCLVLLDFSRAFDCLDVELMLAKLYFYGVDENACSWFKSFLTSRKQFVAIDCNSKVPILSQVASIPRGTPQGSSLSSLLFIIYTADMLQKIHHCKVHLYADDTQIYFHFKPNETIKAIEFIQRDLNAIAEWADDNMLVLNAQKTKYMILGNKHQRASIQERNLLIFLNGERLERVTTVRNLGLYVDEDLRFIEHVNNKIRNAFYKLKVLYGLRRFLTQGVRKTLVDSLVLSAFNYCDSVYGPRLLKKTEHAIQRVQNACTRFIYDIPKRSHISPVLNHHNMLNMKSRRCLHLTMMIHRILHNGRPPYLYERLQWRKERVSIRLKDKWKLSIPKHQKVGFRGCFRFAAAKIWNDLPPPLRQSDKIRSDSSFKQDIKKLLLKKQILGS